MSGNGAADDARVREALGSLSVRADGVVPPAPASRGSRIGSGAGARGAIPAVMAVAAQIEAGRTLLKSDESMANSNHDDHHFRQDEESESSEEEEGDTDEEVALTGHATADPLCPTCLYWGSGSPPAWRARLCLEEKGIPYRSMVLSFEKKQHRTPQLLSLNPRGMLPVFVDRDTVLYESLAIIQYIEMEIKGGITSLLPSNRRLRARSLVRMNEANNVSAAVGEVVYYLRRTAPSQVNEDYLQVKSEALYKEIGLWEHYLDANDFLAGDNVSLADISFFPTIAYTVRLGFDLTKFPRLNGYYIRMLQRPAVEASWPPHWRHGEGAKPLKGL